MAEKYEKEIENITTRLRNAGLDEKVVNEETPEIRNKLGLLVEEWRVPLNEAVRTVAMTVLKAHGIETKYWAGRGTAPLVTIDQVKADNEWVSLKAKVVQIWDATSDKVALAGLIGDDTGVIRFTVFAKNEDIIPDGFAEDRTYMLQNFVSSFWNGQFSVKGNKNSKITPLEENIEVSRKTDTLTGVIIAVGQGSGLIKRCPECNRVIQRGACGEHGKNEGVWDMRIKAVLSPFGENRMIDLIIPREPTERLTALGIEKAKEMAMEALDTSVIGDLMKKKIIGRYYEVTGAMLQSSNMLVQEIKPATEICTEKAIAEALAEAEGKKGGN